MEQRIEVGVLGATGMVGQHFVKFLQNHPWFELKWVGASDRSAGKKYGEATSWRLDGVMPENVSGLTVEESKPGNAPRLLFSAMDASVATEIERAFAEAGHVVVSNSRNHRMEPDVPLLVPEINADHLRIVPAQQRRRGWKGQIVTNPNCSTIVLTLGLAPFKQFGIQRVLATTMQAISGAGYPGVASMDINGNVIPFIGGEEEKMQQETQKILGEIGGDEIRHLDARVSAHCNRVPVVDGHMVATSVELRDKPDEAAILEAISNFRGVPQERNLPSAPARPVVYLEQKDRPQPRRDVERERGMTVFIGRLRSCPVLDFKFMALGHNTVRGAAGAAVLNAELMCSEGMLD
ncbi:MAG: aspartate-semialdehyde dehydrogenase [Bryobacteraceae bacterium]|nr:aspartate-semialdehyde dehydrogenase [Bryobacterales bacterium]MEB2363409.1 aspartate-semialdehyde dehydrogenase [Bryobacterales bacterium]NUN00590.1 aspartate-semialdehyde dehydrogenase [Bryobacteraceae bacterium]